MEAEPETVDAGHAQEVRGVARLVDAVHAVGPRAMRGEVRGHAELVQERRVVFVGQRLENVHGVVIRGCAVRPEETIKE